MFVNTKLFSPIVTDGICTAHPLSLEYRHWWEEQRKRCTEGYSVGGTRITGDHYWYLNFWKIRAKNEKTGRKELLHPSFLDMDYEFFHEVQKARDMGKNLVIAKRRQAGFSAKFSSIIGREFSMFRGSQSIILAGEDKYAQNTMKMVLAGLNSLADTEFYKRRTPDTSEYIQAKYRVNEGGNWVWRGFMSEVYCFTAKSNEQAISGKSPSIVLFEEAGRFKGLIETFKYVEPSLEANFKKTGIAYVVGTGGDMDKGAAELEEMFFHPEVYSMMEYPDDWAGEGQADRSIGLFIPGWKYAVIDSEGNSLKDESIDKILKNREKSKKSSKPNAYITEVTQMPLTPNESFMRTGGSYFDVGQLNLRLAEIRSSREEANIMQKGRLEWIKNDAGIPTGVEWHADPLGDFMILEHPEKDSEGKAYLNLYKGSSDSYDKDDASTSTSKLSCQIFKGFLNASSTSNLFVARYTARPRKAEMAYEASAKLCMYYMAPNLIEWSNVNIFGWYERNGMTNFLRERPRIAYSNIKNSKVNNRYGIDPSTKGYWLEAYRDFLSENLSKMYDQEQIIAAIKYRHDDPKYNCDITISSSLCIVHHLDDRHLVVKNNEKQSDPFYSYKKSNGRIQGSSMRVA